MRRIIGVLLALAALVLGPMATAQASPATPDARARVGGHTPVVFVHGYVGNATNWLTAEAVFLASGYTADELYTYDYDFNQSNKRSAAGLASFVDRVRSQTGADRVDIVNHSMGGLVTNWYVKKLGGHTKVEHVASIAGANHGTTWAAACVLFASCQEMLPGSNFLKELNQGDETPGDTAYATWYSPCDGIIIPFDSTVLGGASNRYVPCQTHLGYLVDTVVLGQVRGFLNT